MLGTCEPDGIQCSGGAHPLTCPATCCFVFWPETLKALGANPVSMNFDQALVAFQLGKVDGQENPIGLIIPYKLWAVHSYITLWRYTIDPLILAVSGKTWAMLGAEDRNVVRQVSRDDGAAEGGSA